MKARLFSDRPPDPRTVGPLVLGAIALMQCLAAGTSFATVVNFDASTCGAPPAGWTAGKTGKGGPNWSVEQSPGAPSGPNVLQQSGDATYPVCILNGTHLRDGFVEVKFKTVSGREDQAGGVLWRALDADNYYVARANALEDNVAIYYTVAGKRSEKKRADIKVAPGIWHTLRVDFEANRFRVTFDGKPALEWQDATFRGPGAVGVWTKADSHTLFDDFTYEAK